MGTLAVFAIVVGYLAYCIYRRRHQKTMEDIERELEEEEGIEMKLLDYNIEMKERSAKKKFFSAPKSRSGFQEAGNRSKMNSRSKRVSFDPMPNTVHKFDPVDSRSAASSSKPEHMTIVSHDMEPTKPISELETSRDAISMDLQPRLVKIVQINPLTGKKVTKIKRITKRKVRRGETSNKSEIS